VETRFVVTTPAFASGHWKMWEGGAWGDVFNYYYLTRSHAPPAFSRLPAPGPSVSEETASAQGDRGPELPAQPSERRSSATLA